ncbi:MAG: hypothetical protein DWQ44_09395 [Bacteroidetes bacterium]|nr:MAG: hypothetical protein DWQ33_02385 [Bacteroidota bacterium]REK06498.1 MAG: hypothetical protein DWQ39_03185 [Bacteroidota bacterium]REK33264.1 MAG: hypothetical protein DWQ44_09395 [Bacteroidota bacterium]REK47101.1 MAG: hypothetical protein DWQ48_13730 [Bacteroidota bacterium]
MNSIRKTFILFGISVILFSCIKENEFNYDKVAASTWDPDIAIPLVNSTLTINDITGLSSSTSIFSDSTRLVYLAYTGNVVSVNGAEFLILPDQIFYENFSISQADSNLLYNSGNLTLSNSVIIPFNTSGGEQLDSVYLSMGDLNFSLASTVPHNAILEIRMPDVRKHGVPFFLSVPLNGGNGTPVNFQSVTDLSGYKLDFRSSGNFNQLRVDYNLTLSNSGSSSPLTNKDVNINANIENIRIRQAFGYLGQRQMTIREDSAHISLFNNELGGSIILDDPKITFDIKNSFGIPLNARLNSLYAYSAVSGNLNVTGSIPDPLPVSYPILTGQTASGSFTLDKNNSNVHTVLNQNPRYLDFEVSAVTNSPFPVYNFVEDSSKFSVDIKALFPLRGYAQGFVVQDTTEFTLENIDEVKSATFRINIRNAFPARALLQLYFADQSGNILDSMLSDPADQIVRSADMNSSGEVIAAAHEMRDEYFESNRLTNIYTARKIIIRAVIDTKDSPMSSVAIYKNNYIEVKVGVRANLLLKFR